MGKWGELECIEWGDQLQREAVDDERGTVYDDRQSDDDEIHGHGLTNGTTYYYVVVGSEYGGKERELQSGERDAAGIPPPPTN